MEKQKVKNIAIFDIEGDTILIDDISNYKNTGNIARAMDDYRGSYSVIWLDKNLHYQPALEEIQYEIKEYSNNNELKNAFVLGGAGCTIPRFLLLEYKDVKVTTVELSKELVDAANKYFLADLSASESERHKLINGDAFEVIKGEENNKYDIIFVDLFDADKIVESVFHKSFVDDINRIKTDKGLIMYNVSMAEKNDILIKTKKLFPGQNISYHKGTDFNYITIK